MKNELEMKRRGWAWRNILDETHDNGVWDGHLQEVKMMPGGIEKEYSVKGNSNPLHPPSD